MAPPEIGDGGRLLRDLYRSFWTPPTDDRESIRIGLIPSGSKIRFRALERMRIRAYSEVGSWEVASPNDVIWVVETRRIVRPAVVSYFAGVEHRLRGRGEHHPNSDAERWKSRGYLSARWVGPSAMDLEIGGSTTERWVLSLTPPTSEAIAQSACGDAKKAWKVSCHVYGRVELPPLVQANLRAENSNFSKEFSGFLEILSPQGPVELLDFVAEDRVGEPSAEWFGPRLFVVPGLDATLSFVQSTPFFSYLEGVVPSEMFSSAPPEALRSQAIIARTYAVRNVFPEYSTRPFVVCASTNCQVYRGLKLKKPEVSASIHDTANLVVRETSGALAETFYHSICGGHTEPRKGIWGGASQPYLDGVDDEIGSSPTYPLNNDARVEQYLLSPPSSYCGRATLTREDRWRWKVTLSRKDLDRIAESQGLRPPLTDIRVRKRGISGRALDLDLIAGTETKRIRGELEIRMLFGGLLSSLFVLRSVQNGGAIDSLDISGGGYGHGVGLCQMGAIGRAEAGQSYRQILEAYYPGTHVASLSPGGVAAGMVK
ncbi:MAG TPA: SpoIID/LytB domain-containing protein [Bdellovibrionota bacterium]|nr:SpoIID/LytB domain-containing protein [Bdellovibrionota bacterium]